MKTIILHPNINYWIFVIITLLVVFIPNITYADEGTLNFYVTPEFPESQVSESSSYFYLNLKPGSEENLKLKIQNASSEDIKLRITAHTAFTNVHGVVEYGKDADEPDNTISFPLKDLIQTPDVIELDGDETKVIEIPLHMPEKPFEGFLAGGLRIAEIKETQEESNNEGEGVAIKNEFAYVVGIVLSNSRDSVKPDLDLLDVFADQLNYRNVISATLQNFTPTFVNRLSVEATVQRVGEDEILYESSEENMQMAPNSYFHFPISLKGDRLRSGDYLLKLKATSGEEEWEWERSFRIDENTARALNRSDVTVDTSLNWWMIISVSLIIILSLIILIKFIKTRKRNQE